MFKGAVSAYRGKGGWLAAGGSREMIEREGKMLRRWSRDPPEQSYPSGLVPTHWCRFVIISVIRLLACSLSQMFSVGSFPRRTSEINPWD